MHGVTLVEDAIALFVTCVFALNSVSVMTARVAISHAKIALLLLNTDKSMSWRGVVGGGAVVCCHATIRRGEPIDFVVQFRHQVMDGLGGAPACLFCRRVRLFGGFE